MKRLAIPLTALTLVAMACSSPGASDEPDEPSASGTSAPEASNPLGGSLRPVTPPPGDPGSLSPAIVDPIVADAAAKAGVPVSEVVVVSAEPVTWPDGGLGCPLPGMVYPQVVVDGYQVIVQVGPRTYDYRGSSAGKFRLCTTPG